VDQNLPLTWKTSTRSHGPLSIEQTHAFREPWGAPFAPWQAFDLTGAVLADLFLAWALLRGDGGAPGPDYR